MDSRSPTRPSSKVSTTRKAGVTLAATVVTVFGVAASGCLERGLKPVNPCTRSSVGQRIQVTNVDNVDLLFMIDNSNSMAEEQGLLRSELPRLVSVLASGDREGDGTRDFNPVKSLHVGIVTSDMGAGPNTGVPTCGRGLGDDGILRSRSRSTTGGCMATYPSGVFEFDRERGDNPAMFASTVGCVADIGTGGCGFEQQLESALKALTPVSASAWTRPGYSPPRFVSADGVPDSVAGQADGPNTGFVRPNSALAVVLVTDEEDCSVRDYGLFVSGDPRFMSVPLNLRCNTFGDPAMGLIHPIDRYVNGFLGLRSDPSLLIFSGIVGIPPETESLAQAGNYSGILMNSSMIPRPNMMGTNLEPSCSTTNGVAYPPIRIVQTAAGLSASGAAVSLSSICSSSFQPAIDAIIAKIADALRGACLPRALNPAADGTVDCEVFELLPPSGTPGVISDCGMLAGRTFDSTVIDERGTPRQLCQVEQVRRADIMTRPGWYYDDFDTDLTETCGATPQRIAFTGMAPPATGSEVRLECLQTIAIGTGGSTDVNCDGDEGATGCQIGQFCEDPTAHMCGTGRSLPGGGGATLGCDPVDRLCAVPCENDSDCTTAGLLGYVCDRRLNSVAAGEGIDDVPESLRGEQRDFCVNPTCN
jgi:hypothetical protein